MKLIAEAIYLRCPLQILGNCFGAVTRAIIYSQGEGEEKEDEEDLQEYYTILFVAVILWGKFNWLNWFKEEQKSHWR